MKTTFCTTMKSFFSVCFLTTCLICKHSEPVLAVHYQYQHSQMEDAVNVGYNSYQNKFQGDVEELTTEGNGSHPPGPAGIPIDVKNAATDQRRDKRSTDAGEIGEKIMAVAIFLQYQKFFDYDHRYETSYNEKGKTPAKRGTFLQSFPVPKIRLHPEVKPKCESGFFDCLEYLNHFATHTHIYDFLVKNVRAGRIPAHRAPHDYLGQSRTRSELVYQPFRNLLDVFRFRTTAMYYMCWFTMQRITFLARFPGHCRYWLQDDYRVHNKEDFQCALFSFCPDVCCGDVAKYGRNVAHPQMCWSNDKNPCNAVNDGRCLVDFDKNGDFKALMDNKINITCSCGLERKGYVWSSSYGICIENDECYTNNHACPENKICRNTVGSYMCTCRKGYKAWGNRCIRDPKAALIVLDEPTESPVEAETEEPNPFGRGKPVVDKLYDLVTNPKGGTARCPDLKWWLAWFATGVSTYIIKRAST